MSKAFDLSARTWLATLLLLPVGAQGASPPASEVLLSRCAAISNDLSRLSCYDALSGRSQPASETVVHTTPLQPGTSVTAISAQSPRIGTSTSAKPDDDALGKRLADEEQKNDNPFLIRAFKPNYMLVASYTPTRLDRPVYDFSPQQVEAKFQLSFQFDWWDQPFGKNTAFYFGYTQLSFWQLYNSELLGSHASAPFRETNYEPEIGLDLTTHHRLGDMDFRKLRFSFIHQSNGQGGERSRSWNRLAVQSVFGAGNLAGAIRAWYRLPESRASDDNPDITDYLGYGDLTLAYKIKDATLSATLRNNLRRNNRGSIEIDYSQPLNKHIRGYVQYFNGYGESLIDYNRSISRFGIGVALTDWL